MKTSAVLLISVTWVAALCGCATTAPTTADDKASLSASVDEGLSRFLAADSSLKKVLDNAAGYAILPDVGKGGLIVGAAYGKGQVFEAGKRIGYCDLSQGTIGAQIGGQAYSELIIFKDKFSLTSFKSGEFAFAANATAVAVKPGAAATMNYSDGVAVLIHVKGGFMAEASIGGQKLRYQPI